MGSLDPYKKKQKRPFCFFLLWFDNEIYISPAPFFPPLSDGMKQFPDLSCVVFSIYSPGTTFSPISGEKTIITKIRTSRFRSQLGNGGARAKEN